MHRVVVRQYIDSFTRIRIVLNMQTTQLSLVVDRCSPGGEWTENEHGPFDSIGELRDELESLFGEPEEERCAQAQQYRALGSLLCGDATLH